MWGMDTSDAITLGLALGAMVWAIKEVSEMIYVRKMWDRFFHDKEFASGVMKDALSAIVQDIRQEVITAIDKATAVLTAKTETTTQEIMQNADASLDRALTRLESNVGALFSLGISDTIGRLKDDKAFADQVFEFIAVAGINMYQGIHEWATKSLAENAGDGPPIPPSNIKFQKNHFLKPFEAEFNLAADEIKRQLYERRQQAKKTGKEPESGGSIYA